MPVPELLTVESETSLERDEANDSSLSSEEEYSSEASSEVTENLTVENSPKEIIKKVKSEIRAAIKAEWIKNLYWISTATLTESTILKGSFINRSGISSLNELLFPV